MAKTRAKQENKEEIELKTIKLPLKPLVIEYIKIPPLNYSDLILGPKRNYVNPAIVNERLSTVLWLEIYKCFDAHDLVKMLVVCKKLHMVANDDKIRRKLFWTKQNRKLHDFQTKVITKYLNESKDELVQNSLFQAFNCKRTFNSHSRPFSRTRKR